MALVETIQEIKEHCSIVDLNISVDSLKSYLRKAEQYVKECLGTELYNDIVANYPDNLTADQLELMPYIQMPLVNIGLWKWINGGQLQVSDKGVQIDHSGDTKTAFQWQIDNWKEDLDSAGFDGLDELLQYLEDNKATFTTWVADTNAFTINKTFFNADSKSFSKVVNIGDSRRTFKALYPYMEMAHDMEIKPTLGDAFYDELKSALLAGTLTSDQLKLVPMLKKIEAYFAMSKAYGPLRFVANSTGIRVHETLSSIENAATKKAATAIDTQRNAASMEEYGKFYLKTLVKYLNDNASTYATWYASDKYVDPTATPESSTYFGDGWVGV